MTDISFILFCLPGAECRDADFSSLGYTCICHPGYGGINCSIPIDPCAATVCYNGGKCKFDSEINKPLCTCEDGYFGKYCEIVSDPCAGVLCLNSGKCKASLMGNGFLCHCAMGYHGEICELEMNPCESSPCKNHGTCKSNISTFKCICPKQYSGKFCEHEKHTSGHVISTQLDNHVSNDSNILGTVKIGKTLTNNSNSKCYLEFHAIILCVVSLVFYVII